MLTEVKPTSVVVYAVLAEHAAADAGECWPSVARIARRGNVSERTVQTAIQELEATGWITVTARAEDGTQQSNLYRIRRVKRPSHTSANSAGDPRKVCGDPPANSADELDPIELTTTRAAVDNGSGGAWQAPDAACHDCGQPVTTAPNGQPNPLCKRCHAAATAKRPSLAETPVGEPSTRYRSAAETREMLDERKNQDSSGSADRVRAVRDRLRD